ncbi:YopX family protein [Streptococcus equi]|uniref:YopX family protein n=1 Tax=Streptococcus equi TaxID=1336 RepID=UPI003450D487
MSTEIKPKEMYYDVSVVTTFDDKKQHVITDFGMWDEEEYSGTELIDYDLMQSTGQKDCNNSDIFDADILLEPWTGHVVGRVFYSLGDLAWKVLLVGGGEEFLSDCLDLQVCGNIYENPDLLEGLSDG